MERVSFAATIHDPDGRLLPAIQENTAQLTSLFPCWAIAATSRTSLEVREMLINSGGRLIQTAENEIGASRRMSVKLALEGNCDHLLYCDFDRMLHWISVYPDELADLLGTVGQYDYLVVGRTQRAFDTHPLVQRETERITNYVFRLSFGKPYDVTTGTSAMSRPAAELILKHSQALSNATDTEWPTIVSRFLSDRIGFVEVEGMEFETPDYYQSEIAEAGSYEEWMEGLSTSPENWLARLKLTYESVEAMKPFV